MPVWKNFHTMEDLNMTFHFHFANTWMLWTWKVIYEQINRSVCRIRIVKPDRLVVWLIISLWMVSRLQQLILWLNVHHVDFCLIGLHTFDYWILIVLHSSMKLIVLNELNDVSTSCMIVMTLSETNFYFYYSISIKFH